MLRDLAKLGARSIVGGYVAAHGAQKLLGAFGGHGIEGTGGIFESLGLRPGRQMAVAGGAAELGGGLLTAIGHLHPVGPVAVGSTMAVAAATAHRGHGPFAADGGPELPLANLAAVAAMAACDPGRFTVGKRLPALAGAAVAVAGAALAASLVQRARATTASPEAEATSAADRRWQEDDEPALDLSSVA